MPWKRTWPDKPFDFVFERDGVDVGRIYRHQDGQRWQWFGWTKGAPSGVCDCRADAIAAIEASAVGF